MPGLASCQATLRPALTILKRPCDLRGLRVLRQKLGTRLAVGVVFYTGEYAYQHEEGFFVLPTERLWK